MKFDFHTHVGLIPGSAKKSSYSEVITPKRTAEYLKKYSITHTVVLYSDYFYLEQLQELVPEVKIYGVKWINNYNDSLDQGKLLYYGIKLHSHRSRRIIDGKEVFGLDYSDHTYMRKILNRLEDGELVYMHTQDSISTKNSASPHGVMQNAIKYPNLKFIIGHAGHYGALTVAKPIPRPININRKTTTPEEKRALEGTAKFVLSTAATIQAMGVATYFHNIWLDSSIYTKQKAMVLANCDRWCVGSDFPFGPEINTNINIQIRSFEKFMKSITMQQLYQNTINYIETPIQELADKQFHYLTCNRKIGAALFLNQDLK